VCVCVWFVLFLFAQQTLKSVVFIFVCNYSCQYIWNELELKLGPLPVSIIAKQFIAKTVHQELMQKYKVQDNMIVKLTDKNTFTHTQ
jgi:hypothetical protein